MTTRWLMTGLLHELAIFFTIIITITIIMIITIARWLMTGLLHGLAIFFVIVTSPFSLFFVIHRVKPIPFSKYTQ